jgi:hypothetical protein
MTTQQKIDLLLKPLNDATEREFEYFMANKSEMIQLKTTREYHRAWSAQHRERKATPGGAHVVGVGKHITHASGRRKTVCTSAALAFFNIHPSSYHYSGHMDDEANIMRRHGWSVRSRKSAFKTKSKPTLAKVLREIAASTERGHYTLSVRKGGDGHRIVVDESGKIVVDTAECWTTSRCRVVDVRLVRRNSAAQS